MKLCVKETGADRSPGLLGPVPSSLSARETSPSLPVPGLSGRFRWWRKACGRPEALSPWQILTSVPGSWARVKEVKAERAEDRQ